MTEYVHYFVAAVLGGVVLEWLRRIGEKGAGIPERALGVHPYTGLPTALLIFKVFFYIS